MMGNTKKVKTESPNFEKDRLEDGHTMTYPSQNRYPPTASVPGTAPVGSGRGRPPVKETDNNFSRLGLSIEKQQGERKYESDGGVMVGEFVCTCVCACTGVSLW